MTMIDLGVRGIWAVRSLVRKLRFCTEPTLLICDERGYLSLDPQTSNLFHQVVATRHSRHKSTVITTNTAFSEWGNILFNTTIATAIADRLHDFTKAHVMEPGSYYCVSGKVNSADKLYLVMESVKPDAKHNRSSMVPVLVDGARRESSWHDPK